MQLKAVSFNIRYTNDKGGHSIAERAPRLKAILDSVDADVIGFQECRLDWDKLLTSDYGDRYEIYMQNRGDNESAPVLWKKNRFNCIKKGCIWLSDNPEIMSRSWDRFFSRYRICMYAVLEDKNFGKQFCFMNTHYGFGNKNQINSSKLIYEYSKKISELPTLITGDFNMRPDSAGYAQMTKYFTDVNAVTLRYSGTTYHGYSPKNKNQHIDYCFVNDKITPINTVLLDRTFNGKYPSDHFGLLFELKI